MSKTDFLRVVAIVGALFCGSAHAQINNPGVQQSGSVTANHCVTWGPGTGQIQDAGANCAPFLSPANPAATAGPTAINGSASSYMRSDAAPAVQVGSASQKGLLQYDGVGICGSSGVISLCAAYPTAANPTVTAGPAAINGSASTYMRSDAAPAVQKGSNSQFGLVEGDGTTIDCSATLGVCSAKINGVLPTPTRAGDLVYWNGSSWVTLPGNNSGTQVLSENSLGVPAWSAAGSGTMQEQKNTASGGLSTSGNCDNTSTNASNPCNYALSSARQTLPTVSVVTPTSHTGGFSANGSGSYTTPAGVLWIEADLQGAGAGGSGGGSSTVAGTAGGNTCLNTSGAACTTPLYQAGGGQPGGASSGGTGGTISGSASCDWSVPGGVGGVSGPSAASVIGPVSGAGGTSFYGGNGASAASSLAGQNAATNSGSGGSGGGVTTNGNPSGPGGGAGAHCHVLIANPPATLTFVAGAKGTGGAAGSGGAAGGNGGDGEIVIYEHYGS